MKFIDRADAIAKRLERFIAGNSAADPLYLTNRTVGQKIRLVVLIGTPMLALGLLLYLALGKQFYRPTPQTREAAVALASKPLERTGEVTAKVLPNLERTYVSEQSKEIDVVEAAVSRGAEPMLVGKLRNNTATTVRMAEVVFDITDDEGSQLGGVAVRVENIPPNAAASFRQALPQKSARSAIVRDVTAR